MNGDITLEALRQCHCTSVFYIYICRFITAVQTSTAGIFWSRNLSLSVILLRRTKFRVNQTVCLNRRDITEKGISLWRPSAILNLQNFGILLSSRP